LLLYLNGKRFNRSLLAYQTNYLYTNRVKESEIEVNMTTAAQIVLLVLSFIMIIITLLQSGKSEGASAAVMGGNKMNIFTRTKERGADKVMTIITAVFCVAFFITALLCNYL
jgi:preprotein translocase subunit SecG